MTPRLLGRVAAFLFLAGSVDAAPQARGGKAAAPGAAAVTKRPLAHRDYDSWRSIATPVLSRDGRYLAYSYMPQEGDGDLVVRDLKTGREQRYGAGALPPPPLPDPDANPDAPPPVRNVRISFTGDSRYVVCTTYPLKADTDKAKKEKKKPEEMPKGGLVIVDLTTFESSSIASVKSVQVPSKAGTWIAYSKAPTGPAAPPAKPGVTRKEYGTDLVVRDLMSGQERTFPSVLEYAAARDGQTLLFAVSSKTEAENGVFAMNAGASRETPTTLASGPGRYLKVTWDREQKQAAFVSDRDEVAASAQAPRFKAYLWNRGPASATAVIDSSTPGMKATLSVSDKGAVAFSRDGSRLYVPTAAPAEPPAAEGDDAPADEKVVLDIWNYRDDLVQPMQRIRAAQERSRTYRGVYQIEGKRYVQISDPSLRSVIMSDDGSRAIGLDDAPYRRMIDFDGTYSDVYLVDASTGERKPVAKKWRGGGFGSSFQWSPKGDVAVFYADKHWHALNAGDGSVQNLTDKLPVAFYDEEDDTPDPPTGYGTAGWTKDSASALVYDRYDVWQLFVDGRPAKNLTEGEGRRLKTIYRVERTEPLDEDDDDRGFDLGKPLTLRGENDLTHETGFYKDSFDGVASPMRLMAGQKSHRFVGRAKDADAFLVTAQRFDEFPDVYVTDSSFKTLTKVTNGGAQLAPFTWGKAELVDFKNSDGTPLQAGLIKPEGFDPKKKYPMIVYIYETLSENVHNFVNPGPGTSINLAYYASNGYLILTPDIVYTLGQPGEDALKSVLPALQAVADQGFVDEANIGIQGHSWGGYQIAYMLTRTSRFKAAEAGAPVGNMTSAYSGIRWGSGMPRQFQYEQTQSRIGPSLYEAPLKYFDASPVFQAPRVTTPVLIIANDSDDAVPWYQGIEYFLSLRRNNKEAYLFNYNGEFHGLRKRHNQKDYTVRMQQFFDHFLKAAPKPEWMEHGVPYIEREEEKGRFLKGVYK
ncbi:MAG: S9 family peptidase [Vicinamibacteria bacterium]|nr:S9 family peptidase [Vicinamibacteria bacterium]